MFEFVVCGPGMYFGDIRIPTSHHRSQCVYGMRKCVQCPENTTETVCETNWPCAWMMLAPVMEGQVCQVVTNPDVVSVVKYQG